MKICRQKCKKWIGFDWLLKVNSLTTGNQTLALKMNLIYEYFRKYCAWSGLFIWRQGSLWWQYFDKTPPLLCQILKDKLLQFKRGLSWKQEINKPRLQNNPAQTKVCISSLKSKLKLLRDKNIMPLTFKRRRTWFTFPNGWIDLYHKNSCVKANQPLI